jgi:hypothetical protein
MSNITVKSREANWNDHILRRSYNLKQVFAGKTEGGIEVKGKRGRRLKQILDDVKETRRSWKLQGESLDHTLRRTCFARVRVGMSNRVHRNPPLFPILRHMNPDKDLPSCLRPS